MTLSIALLLIGSFETYRSWTYLFVDKISARLMWGTAVKPQEAADAFDQIRIASLLLPDVQLAWELSGAAMASFNATTNDAGVERLKIAERQLERALLWNPGDGYGWSRLAGIRLALEGPSRRVVEPIILSIRATPYDRGLILGRLTTALRTWTFMNQSELELIHHQIRLCYQSARDRTRIASIAIATSTTGVVMAALFGQSLEDGSPANMYFFRETENLLSRK
jgi:hypothetical protein